MTMKHARLARGLVATALAALVAASAPAVSHLKGGQQPPPIALDTIEGGQASLDDSRGRPVVVVFGELYHRKTLEACGAIKEALSSETLSGDAVTVLLVIAQQAPVETLQQNAGDPRLPAVILHDVRRKAYADYRVTVMPSVVVLDKEGRVVHAIAGYSARLKDIVTDALLVAAGRLTRERFAERLHPAADDAVDEAGVRAARLTSLAGQLARRGLERLAEAKYGEALVEAPEYIPARLGLAMAALRSRRLAAAGEEFRKVLAIDPASFEASLGLAYVQTLRGGDELDEAYDRVRGMLQANSETPRAHYLLGLIQEQRGEPAEAAASFRRAAELLMSRRESWTVIPGSLNHERE